MKNFNPKQMVVKNLEDKNEQDIVKKEMIGKTENSDKKTVHVNIEKLENNNLKAISLSDDDVSVNNDKKEFSDRIADKMENEVTNVVLENKAYSETNEKKELKKDLVSDEIENKINEEKNNDTNGENKLKVEYLKNIATNDNADSKDNEVKVKDEDNELKVSDNADNKNKLKTDAAINDNKELDNNTKEKLNDNVRDTKSEKSNFGNTNTFRIDLLNKMKISSQNKNFVDKKNNTSPFLSKKIDNNSTNDNNDNKNVSFLNQVDPEVVKAGMAKQNEFIQKMIGTKSIFTAKCRLFFYSTITNQMETRGDGTLSVFKDEKSKYYRLLMIREKVMLTGCDHFILPNYPLSKGNQKNCWYWTAYADKSYSISKDKFTRFFVQFFTDEDSDLFKAKYDEALQYNASILNAK